MICFCSLYTTWVYVRLWRERGSDLHYMLAKHKRFLERYEVLCRRDEVQRGLLQLMGETDPLAGSRTLRFVLIVAFQCPALLCCGVPFACLAAIHFALNAHAIILLRCIKRSLELSGDLEGHFKLRGLRAPVDELIMQHQHVLSMVNTNNEIFARPITERLVITYALLGLTAYCMSSDPLADVKVPIIAFFMIASLLQMSVLSDMLKDECGSLQDVVWRCDWMSASRPTQRKLVLLTARAQRYDRDGLAAAGLQDRISMITFVQAGQIGFS
ncbi:uncharacterized protein LOC117644785 [Thrips palmi]|uniref:Uncharacterized protein LOC117644785 n=1 Tax=Thrips palmi TaxID=161013 RepID=A0A6P8ZMB1_THRPL|nr:uncharacterized protein LOC117644785 [Thrips palmi]